MQRSAVIKRITAVVVVAAFATAGWYAWRRLRTTAPPIATAQAVRGDFDVAVKARDEGWALVAGERR